MSHSAPVLALALVLLTACSQSAAPAPPPDPFSTVSQRAAALRAEGRELLEQGHAPEALEAFRRAQLLSPTDDPETNATVARLARELAPTPVPVPPTPTAIEVVPPTPVAAPTPVATPTLVPIPTPAPVPTDTPMPLPPRTATPVPAPAPAPPQQVVYVPVPAAAPTPTPALAAAIFVAEGPSAVAVSDDGVAYVADHAGQIWIVDRALPTLRRPFAVSGDPTGLAFDSSTTRLYVATRGQPTIVALDAASGQLLASTSLPADPSRIELDRDANLLLVVLPQDDTIRRFAVPTLGELDPIRGLSDVTGIAVDLSTQVLYATQLDGTLAVVDIQAGTVRERRQISGIGLTGVSTSATRTVAINTPGQELLSLDRTSGELSHIALAAPPASIVASSGTAYVLEPTSDAVVCLDPSNGAELGRIGLGDARMDSPPLQADLLWVWPNMRIAADETVFMTAPSAGVVARFKCPARS